MSKMPDYLLGGRVIVKPLKKQEETIEGIIIPRTANADLMEGLVVMVDGAVKYVNSSDGQIKCIEVGHIVIYPADAGVGQFVNNEPHLWLEAYHIWGGFAINEE